MTTLSSEVPVLAKIADDLGLRAEDLALSTALEGDIVVGLDLYSRLANARAAGKRTAVIRVGNGAHGAALDALGFHGLRGGSFYGAVLEEALHKVYDGLTSSDQSAARSTFSAQIESRVARHVDEFYQGPWVRAVRAHELSLLQYMVTLENMHQYVRFTTRLLGRAVACSKTTPLRAHFAKHLSGEVNHEILIERDLESIGRDPGYLRAARYANADTRAFMVLEQSLASFECDPVLFAACPLAAEGITAHMDKAFLADLRACVAKERPAEAKKATVFFASHIETDGGDDGHWASTMKLLHDNLPDERSLGEMLTVLELAASSFTRSFNANVEDYRLFGAAR